MKSDARKYLETEAAGERYFKIIYRVTLALALIGAAMFCVVQWFHLDKSTIVFSSSGGSSPVFDTNLTARLQSNLEKLRQEKVDLLLRVEDAEKRWVINSNAFQAMKMEKRQATQEMKLAQDQIVSLKTDLDKKRAETPTEAPPGNAEIASLNKVKSDLTAAINKLEAEKRSAEDGARRAKQDKDRKLQEVSKVQKEIVTAKKNQAKARQDTAKVRQETNRHRQEANRARNEKGRFENDLKRLKQQKDSATKELNRMNSDRKTAEAKRRQAENEMKALQVRQSDLAYELWKLTAQKLSIVNMQNSKPTNGLQVTYFKSTNLTGPGIRRIDPVIDFDWKDRGPIAELGADNFSARWEGQLEAPADGNFTMYTVSNDGVRLWVNGKRIIDQWNQHGATEHKGTIQMKAGQRYDLKMEFFEAGGTAVAKLAWSGPGLSRTIVPASSLFPSKD